MKNIKTWLKNLFNTNENGLLFILKNIEWLNNNQTNKEQVNYYINEIRTSLHKGRKVKHYYDKEERYRKEHNNK